MRFFRQIVLAAGLLALPLAAFAQEKLPVVTSFSILGDIVSSVGGERVKVISLVGADQDAHVFEPKPTDVNAVQQAKMVVMNGLGFEGWMVRLTKSAKFKGETVVASRGVKARQMEDEHDHHHHGKQESDPHAWQDPRNVKLYVKNIVAALSKLDPAGASVYEQNGARYITELDALDAWAAEQYASVPAAKRKLITAHDAFGYHSARYGIQFLAPSGVSTEHDASAQDVAKLIRQIKREKIKAVFIENMSNSKLLEKLAKEVGVTPSGKLYADALSRADGPAATYLSMMRYNVTQILAGLRQNP